MVEIIIFSLIVLLASNQAYSTLLCYTCESASKKACEKSHQLVMCPRASRGCVTLAQSYRVQSGGSHVMKHTYAKACAVDGCESACENMGLLKGEKCEVDCCVGNKCNKQEKTQTVLRVNNIARFYERTNPTNSAENSHINFLIFCPLFLLHIIWTN